MENDMARDSPLRSDFGHRPDIRSRRQNEFIEDDPFRLCIQTTRRVETDNLAPSSMITRGKNWTNSTHLVILDCQIVTFITLLVCDLHEEAIAQYFPNIDTPLSFICS